MAAVLARIIQIKQAPHSLNRSSLQVSVQLQKSPSLARPRQSTFEFLSCVSYSTARVNIHTPISILYAQCSLCHSRILPWQFPSLASTFFSISMQFTALPGDQRFHLPGSFHRLFSELSDLDLTDTG